MAAIDGQWDSIVQSPMGEQKSVMTLTSRPDGSFAGVNAGTLGSVDIENGQVSGDTVTFSMELKLPFPMTLTGTATLSGDAMTGQVKAGVFGEFPFSAVRRA